jgi:uncharacterized membrane protein YeaQ/YmgE (transglycosylase-associated protein family)
MHVLWWIIVGLIAGWATGKIMRGSGYGPLMDIVIGIAGALIGGWIMRVLGFAGQGGTICTILVAIGGAIVLTLIYRALIDISPISAGPFVRNLTASSSTPDC